MFTFHLNNLSRNLAQGIRLMNTWKTRCLYSLVEVFLNISTAHYIIKCCSMYKAPKSAYKKNASAGICQRKACYYTKALFAHPAFVLPESNFSSFRLSLVYDRTQSSLQPWLSFAMQMRPKIPRTKRWKKNEEVVLPARFLLSNLLFWRWQSRSVLDRVFYIAQWCLSVLP